MPDRVILFVDYQNVYRGSRDCFQPESYVPHTEGQISPAKLGELLTHRGLSPRHLVQVRVYRGQPVESKDQKGYGACTRQIATWAHDVRVKVITRTLRYPYGWPGRCQPGEKPQEKGVDVALAIDFVRLAIEDRYDIGILMSTDTDLKPALEIVTQLRLRGDCQARVEVAAWSRNDGGHSRRLSITGAKVWCHWLDKAAYESVCDRTDYTRPLS